MCGILGIIAPRAESYKENLKRMQDSLSHRGPDETGQYLSEQSALGHVRLSIVDLSAGQQPMRGEGNTTLVFNGEIYGYQDIKKSLSYPFTTESDTEVILALYQKYGTSLTEHLPGMFAFALWDEKTKELLCARDRFGEKPLFYATGKNGEFIFASEIKAILSSGLVDPELSLESVAHYLQYLYVHPHTTIYKNIHALPPAHTLVYKNGVIQLERYWKFPKLENSISLGDAAENFQALFEKSVRDQLVADVPVGAFLSGGLDSSTVVAVASKLHPHIQTFSFSFEESINELPYAREIASKYGTTHMELSDSSHDKGSLLLEMARVYDEPFGDSSNIPTYLISKLASEHVKVVLTGDGGDELLGGYSGWYKPFLYTGSGNSPRLFERLMPSLISLSHKLHLPFAERLGFTEEGRKLAQWKSVLDAHENQMSYFTCDELAGLLTSKADAQKYIAHWEKDNTLNDVLRMDAGDYMPGDILTKIDRASMAWGLELRAPFLDQKLAEFCLSLPYTLKIDAASDKILLREAYGSAWTESIRGRRKQGFGSPVGKWLRDPSVRTVKDTYLNDPHKKIFSLVSFDNSRPYVTKDNYQTWALLVLSIWLETRHA